MLGFAMLQPASAGQVHAQVKVRFVVTLGENALTDEAIFLAGNHPRLGTWKPAGLKLEKQPSGQYVAEAEFPVGTELEFKVTRGDWSTVEKNSSGQEIENRKLRIQSQPAERTSVQECPILVQKWANANHAVRPKTPVSSVKGRLEIQEPDPAQPGALDRRIAVWLPPQYEQDPAARFPVLYMHDGQNLFDSADSAFGVEWQLDETATHLIEQGKIEPLIIVGVWNTRDRIREYTPAIPSPLSNTESDAIDDQAATPTQQAELTGGDRYLDFLVNRIKPMVDQKYRTRPEREFTAIGGSSLGGLISLYAGVKHSEVFSRYAVISPSLGWNEEQLLRVLEQDPSIAQKFNQARVWIDMGTREGSTPLGQRTNVERTRRLVQVMNRVGLDSEEELQHLTVAEGQHNERAWADRIDEILQFLFPKQ